MHTTLPTHPTLRHPLTGEPLRALGVTKYGRWIWPQLGGDETAGTGGDTGGTGTGTTGAPAAPPTGQTGQAGQPAGDGLDDLPEKWRKEIEKLRGENARDRTTSKEKAAQEARQTLLSEISKALGLNPDEASTDPAVLTKQLAEERERGQDALAEAIEYRVYRIATKAGANAEKLLDSRAFIRAVDDLDVDPNDAKAFTAAIEKAVKEALDADPGLRANPGTQTTTRQGADHTGGNNGRQRPRSLGAAITNAMSRN